MMCFRQLILTVILMGLSIHTVLPQSLVEYLPGFPGKLPFKLETGYIGVGESEEIQLFYYFIESERSPENDPLLLWLQGGPGCSSFSGLVYEMGPLMFDYAKTDSPIPTLVLNPYSWTKLSNIIFLDQPVGTGFSYTKPPGTYEFNDTLAAKLTYQFLKKWIINHPKYQKNPFYAAGESYCGLVLPLVVDEIYNGIKAGIEPHLNMKGYILGNPITDKFLESNGRVDYAHRKGLLSDELYLSAKENCDGNYVSEEPRNNLCKNDLKRVNQCVEKIYLLNILEPWCDMTNAKRQDRMGLLSDELYLSAKENCDGNYVSEEPRNNLCKNDLKRVNQCVENIYLLNTLEPWCDMTNAKRRDRSLMSYSSDEEEIKASSFLQSLPLHAESWCRPVYYLYSETWANLKIVQTALHVREGTIIEWVRCNHTLSEESYINNVKSVVSYHKKFANQSDCRTLIYSGDLDMAVAHTTTEGWIRSLKLPIKSDWRPWFVEGQIAGYTTVYFTNNSELTYATVKGGGHTAPEYKPRECLFLIDRWLSHNPL